MIIILGPDLHIFGPSKQNHQNVYSSCVSGLLDFSNISNKSNIEFGDKVTHNLKTPKAFGLFVLFRKHKYRTLSVKSITKKSTIINVKPGSLMFSKLPFKRGLYLYNTTSGPEKKCHGKKSLKSGA